MGSDAHRETREAKGLKAVGEGKAEGEGQAVREGKAIGEAKGTMVVEEEVTRLPLEQSGAGGDARTMSRDTESCSVLTPDLHVLTPARRTTRPAQAWVSMR